VKVTTKFDEWRTWGLAFGQLIAKKAWDGDLVTINPKNAAQIFFFEMRIKKEESMHPTVLVIIPNAHGAVQVALAL
jgi:hypothetical protein